MVLLLLLLLLLLALSLRDVCTTLAAATRHRFRVLRSATLFPTCVQSQWRTYNTYSTATLRE
jgi:hypothetical protein